MVKKIKIYTILVFSMVTRIESIRELLHLLMKLSTCACLLSLRFHTIHDSAFQIREKTQNEIQHCADQGTPSIRRETNYVEQDEQDENQNMGPQGLADEGERIHSIVDEMEAEDQTAIEMEEYEAHLMTSSTHCQKSGRSMVLAVMS